VQSLGQATAVEHEPLTPVAASVQASNWSRQQRQPPAHGAHHDEVPAAHAAYRLEATQRVAQQLEHIAHDDDVELALFVGLKVVHAQVKMARRRAEQFGATANV
jgi:hypothetical protein